MSQETIKPIELNLNSELALFGWSGEGYYSESEDYEIMFLPKEQYEIFNVKDAFEGCSKYFYGLDGKHSEVEGELFLKEMTLKELIEDTTLYEYILADKFDFYPSNDDWYESLFNENGKYVFNLYDLKNEYLQQLENIKNSFSILTFLVPNEHKKEIENLVTNFLKGK